MTFKKRISLKKKVFFFFLIAVLGIPFLAQEEDPQEPLHYRVSVNVMVVPIFAVDKSGNPVHDLKKEELQLYVNDRPTYILGFKRYEFGHEETIVEKTKSGETVEAVRRPGERFIFVILDTMFNDLTGFRRGKEIAVNLVKQGLPGDHFVILENNPIGGLKYIGCSEENPNSLIKKIKKVNPPPDKWTPEMYSSRLIRGNVTESSMGDPRQVTSKWESHRKLRLDSERLRYQHQVKHFAQVLSQFKYALKTIDKPKIVFLISEGMARGSFRAALEKTDPSDADRVPEPPHRREGNVPLSSGDKGFYSILYKDEKSVFDQNKIYSAFMLKYLLDVVKSINNGGSVLYTINPRRADDVSDDETSGEMSLRYLAGESGGKYFAGSKPVKIAQRVKKTTAAYYELFYSISPEMGNNMTVQIQCSRKNVHIHSLTHTERNRPYHRMEPVQKKLFALNVVTNGSWSRIVGKVMKAKYKKSKSSKGESMNIRVLLPQVMQDRKLDMFSIRMDPKTQKTDIDVFSSEVMDAATLDIKPRKDKMQFFVIIEPTTPYCLYNKI